MASLNHPMIAAIYGFYEADGKQLLVLELVEGPTLADCLADGRLPVEASLNVARQVAEALEVAHEKGIIHRDLKSANIKMAPNGQVKILDFGLAKALIGHDRETEPDLSTAPTITQDFTRPAAVVQGHRTPRTILPQRQPPLAIPPIRSCRRTHQPTSVS